MFCAADSARECDWYCKTIRERLGFVEPSEAWHCPYGEDAAERALSVADLGGDIPWDKCAEQIREAEQAARLDEREKVLEEAAKLADLQATDGLFPDRPGSFQVKVIAKAIRALKET